MSIESEDDEAPDPAEVELYSYRDKPIRDMTIWELFTGLVGAAQMSLPERDRDSDGTEYERIAPGVFMAKPDPKADHGK